MDHDVFPKTRENLTKTNKPNNVKNKKQPRRISGERESSVEPPLSFDKN